MFVFLLNSNNHFLHTELVFVAFVITGAFAIYPCAGFYVAVIVHPIDEHIQYLLKMWVRSKLWSYFSSFCRVCFVKDVILTALGRRNAAVLRLGVAAGGAGSQPYTSLPSWHCVIRLRAELRGRMSQKVKPGENQRCLRDLFRGPAWCPLAQLPAPAQGWEQKPVTRDVSQKIARSCLFQG